MATRTLDPVEQIRGLLKTKRWSHLRLADESGVKYKHVLHMVKAADRELTLPATIAFAEALDVPLSALVEAEDDAEEEGA